MSGIQVIEPLRTDRLQALPLPKQLKLLPPNMLEQFVQLYQLVLGYVKTLKGYETWKQEVVGVLNEQIGKLNRIIEILEEYQGYGTKIDEQIHQIEQKFQEFVNLETYQYQLLSSNFNQDFLKQKYRKMIDKDGQEANDIVKRHGTGDDELNELVQEFRASRKQYHRRKEVLNRWNQERVSGFV